jgi:hydroxymethylglutaryl-CoA lyase
MMLVLPDQVSIHEVGPRDGFQSWPRFIPTAVKIEVVKALIAAGVREIETTSFVDPRSIPQMADAAEVMSAVPREGVIHTALVPNLRGAQLAIDAGVDRINVIISASEAHNKANLNCSIDNSLSTLASIAKLAQNHSTDLAATVAVAFGCPYEGLVEIEAVQRLVEAFVGHGFGSIILGDTTNMATPMRVIQMVEILKGRFPDIEIVLHFHNNRGSAMANLLAGLQAGVCVFDTALGGMGGCPNVPQAAGNLATEDVVCMLEDMGIHTGVDLTALLKAAHFLQENLHQTLPGHVLKSGPILPDAPCGPCCKA